MPQNMNDPGRPNPTITTGKSADTTPHVEWTPDLHSWMDEALCQGWHPDARDRERSEEELRRMEWIDLPSGAAKKVCRSCPVRDACLQRSLKMRPLPADGVWGGATWRELRAMVAPTIVAVRSDVAA